MSRVSATRARTALAWVLVAPWAAWAVMRAAGLDRGFPLVQIVAYTPYAVVPAAVAALAALLLRRRPAAAVGAIAAVVLGALVAPRALGGGEGGAAAGPRLRVVTANVYSGGVTPGEVVVLARHERADVLALQELTPAVAAELTPRLRPVLPHALVAAWPGAAGTALYSRHPLRELPVAPGSRLAMTPAELRVPGAAPVRVASVHPTAPLRRSATGRWRGDLRSLPPAPARGPVQILAGDFNATLDHRELRHVLGSGYRDAADVAGAGLRPTWRGRRAPPVTIDHVLAPGRVAVLGVEVREVRGSDHRAVAVTLALPRGPDAR
jgi:endonuclease/exonuclease/phosphatase (EEP) superfamily protein YafD